MSTYQVSFDAPPVVGTLLSMPSRRGVKHYKVTAVRDYVRQRDGQPSHVVEWIDEYGGRFTSGLRGNFSRSRDESFWDVIS